MSGLFDAKTVAAADKAVQSMITTILSQSGRGVVVGEAPAGAGKSYAVATAVLSALRRGLRVAVATPTNEQAFSLVDGIASRCPATETVTFVPASKVSLPEGVAARRNVQQVMAKHANNSSLVVGTLSKLGDAFSRGDLSPFDLLLIDEAFQANAVHYYSVGALADRHLLMGDRGQLAPFTTAPEGHRWRGLDEDPLLTAVEVIQRNHPNSTTTYKLPVTRRLDSRGATVARAFYPGHPFGAAVLPGVRRLQFSAKDSRTPIDKALNSAAECGWAHVEMAGAALALADPSTIEFILELLQRLLDRGPVAQCETHRRAKPVQANEIAVAVSHNDQKNLLRVALDDAGLTDVVVNTANKLQGLTYEIVIAWHPLAGLVDVDEFHLDPGRLCVMLTRHRHACIVVGRAADRSLVEGIPPTSPAYVGWDENPALDGWYAHEAVFNLLEPHRIEVP